MPEITPDLTGFVRRAIADPGSILPRVDGETVSNWSARAVLATLDRDGTLYSRIETALAAEVDADEYTPALAASAAYRAVLPVVADYDIQRREAEDDRDRARDTAVALEQENARLTERITAAVKAARERDADLLHMRDNAKNPRRTMTRGHAWEIAAHEIRKVADLLKGGETP